MGNTHLDTIAALSTPPGESGIAVVRMSGPNVLNILSQIFSGNTGRRSPADFEHRRTYHGHIIRDDGTPIDEVVCAIARAPESYTGEDTVEISCHGNTLIVRRLLELLFGSGARAAEAGEFTRRAFINGKMDLIQAEAVADLIHARSDLQRRVAQEQLAGGLSRRIDRLADEMLAMLGLIEANIDFIEADIDTLDVTACLATLERHRAELDALLDHAAMARPFHGGFRVAIVGPVNAGKSSLFNRLLGDNRAIVTEVPGTTRDVLREPIVIDGVLFTVHDTAGIRGTEDRVESIGVDRAREAMERADVVILVVDLSSVSAPEWPLLPEAHTIVALNKCDVAAGHDDPALRPDVRAVRTSALTGQGLDELRKSLVECVGRDRLNWIARERIVLNERLVALLGEALRRLDALEANLRVNTPLEILAVDARELLRQYEAATGKRYEDGLLDVIFSRFCIGK